MKRDNPLFLVLIVVVPLFCVFVLLTGIVGAGFIYTYSTENNITASNAAVDPALVEAEVLAIAAEHANTGDVEAAQARLTALGLPNSDQYVSFMVDRYLQENRDPDDTDTMNLFLLADALGATTPAMVAALSTPTVVLTPTLPPTSTSLPPTATHTPEPPTATSEPVESTPTEVVVEEVPPTDTPVPTDTPEPPTATLGPPTNTPEPTATPEPPPPAIDFVVAEANLIPNPTYNSCPGSHQIFVNVIDAGGNPIDGVSVEDTFKVVPPKMSGEKGPGKLEYDLWNNGFSLQVTKKADGAPATSEVTPKLSSWDEDIPNEWLVQANYCLDINDCLQRKSNNQLCRGHYSYSVTFRRTY
jgi:hypothetical protein